MKPAHQLPPVDLPARIAAVQAATGRARLHAAWEYHRRAMARVHPTPTYDAVVAARGFDPRLS